MTKYREIMDKYGDKLIPIETNSGIYFLIKNNEIVYIGQSKSVHVRVAQHTG